MTTQPFEENVLFEGLRSLKGKHCWGVVAGKGTGSMVALDFGGRVSRSKRLENPHLTLEQQRFTGEYSLFIGCSWRLDGPDAVVCGCEDSNVEDGSMLGGLQSLVGQAVTDVEISPPGYDLVVGFDDATSLRVFCEHTDKKEEEDNYSFFTPDSVYTVGCRSVASIEIRVGFNRRPVQ